MLRETWREKRALRTALKKKTKLIQPIVDEASRSVDTAVRDIQNRLRLLPQDGVQCPRCQSRMSFRKGPYGHFYGCDRYPMCRGTRSLTNAEKIR